MICMGSLDERVAGPPDAVPGRRLPRLNQIARNRDRSTTEAHSRTLSEENRLERSCGQHRGVLHRPGDAASLGIRIVEFRIGARLLHSTYGPLDPEDKAWLLEQCRAWAKALDGHLQALDGGADPLAVRGR